MYGGPSLREGAAVAFEVAKLLILLGLGGGLLLAGVVATVVVTAIRPPLRTEVTAILRGRPVTPDDLGLPYDAWSVRRPDGVDIPAWTIETGAEAPAIPLVVLAHGWPRCRRDLLDRLGPWRTRAARIVLFDARGHGDANGRCTMGRLEAADLLAVAEAATGPDGSPDAGAAGRPVLAGWSIGATTVMLAAEAEPAAVAAVVAIAPVLDRRVALAARVREQGLPAGLVVPLSEFILRRLGAWGPVPRPEATAVPHLLVQGTVDAVCPLPGAEAFVAAAPPGAVRLLTVSGHGHDEPDRAAGAEFEAALDELLAAVARTG